MLRCHYVGANFVTIWMISTWLTTLCTGSSDVQNQHACFSKVFTVTCKENELLVFEEARYGRNDTFIARECETPFYRNCDIDVHFTLNRACAGKQKCSLAINTALFGDPCGYNEFLKVKYRCVAEKNLSRGCKESEGPLLLNRGHIASPNYPANYYRDAECFWFLSVQQQQTIRVTMFDFELDVKKKGECTDYLEVSSGSRVYFKDCGGLGRQSIDIDSNQAMVKFKTGLNSLTDRGFLIYFEAIGPGCPYLDNLKHGSVVNYIRKDVLLANASCDRGYVFLGTNVDTLSLKCMGSSWSKAVIQCIASPPNTTPYGLMPPTLYHRPTTEDEKSSMIDSKFVISRTTGIALGVVSALLLLVLLLIITVYFQRRRRHRKAEKEHWRVVVNNLQENELNSYDEEQQWKNAHLEDTVSPQCNLKKDKKQRSKKINNKEEELQGRNLLTEPCYDSDHDTYMMDYSDFHRDFQSTPVKSVPHETIYNRSMHEPIYNRANEPMYSKTPQRRSSRGSKHMLFKKKSMEGQLDGHGQQQQATLPPPRRNKSFCAECGTTPRQGRPQSQRDLRHKRTKSGHWDPNKTLAYIQPTDVAMPANPRALTQSAPDLLELCKAADAHHAPVVWNQPSDQIYNYPPSQPVSTMPESRLHGYGAGTETPISVYATQHHPSPSYNTDTTPSPHSYALQQPNSANSDHNALYMTQVSNRSRKGPQYVVPPTPPERNIQDMRC